MYISPKNVFSIHGYSIELVNAFSFINKYVQNNQSYIYTKVRQ